MRPKSTPLPPPISSSNLVDKKPKQVREATQLKALEMRQILRARPGISKKQACDQCRRSRIKCSRSYPVCAGCVEHQTSCTYSDVLMKRGPPTHAERRILLQAGLPPDVSYASTKRRAPASRKSFEARAEQSMTQSQLLEAQSPETPHTKQATLPPDSFPLSEEQVFQGLLDQPHFRPPVDLMGLPQPKSSATVTSSLSAGSHTSPEHLLSVVSTESLANLLFSFAPPQHSEHSEIFLPKVERLRAMQVGDGTIENRQYPSHLLTHATSLTDFLIPHRPL